MIISARIRVYKRFFKISSMYCFQKEISVLLPLTGKENDIIFGAFDYLSFLLICPASDTDSYCHGQYTYHRCHTG
jgi:hypothetical protein